MHAILKEDIFGPCVAHVYSIEFQKRGLPHMHLSFIFEERIQTTLSRNCR